jgi:hypothetical protein
MEGKRFTRGKEGRAGAPSPRFANVYGVVVTVTSSMNSLFP